MASTAERRFKANIKTDYNELPEIQDGVSCIAGKVYKLSCNRCQCGLNNALLCTKMACLEDTIFRRFVEMKNKKSKARRPQKNPTKIKRERNLKKYIKPFPKLPKGECVPGKIYTKSCNKCFCKEDKVPVCTKLCSKSVSQRITDQELSQIETRSVLDLPELPHMGMDCKPGKIYHVACNLCFCSDKQDLICTMKYCLSIKSYADIRANKLQGTPCKIDFTELCVKCKCVNKKSECSTTKNCNNLTGKQMLTSIGNKVKLVLDATQDRCVPNATYKIHCNDCYCQPEGTLRCTQKICLSYSQARDLSKTENNLEKYGL